MKKLGPQHNIPADEWYRGSGLYIVSSFFNPAAYTGTAAPSKKLESWNCIICYLTCVDAYRYYKNSYCNKTVNGKYLGIDLAWIFGCIKIRILF